MFFGGFLKTSNGCLIHLSIKLSNVIRSTRSMRMKRRPMTKKMCFMIIAQVGWNQLAIFPRFSIASCEAAMTSKISRSSFLYKDNQSSNIPWPTYSVPFILQAFLKSYTLAFPTLWTWWNLIILIWKCNTNWALGQHRDSFSVPANSA